MSDLLTKRIKELRGEGSLVGDRRFFSPVPEMVLGDGLTLSVQASETHYCTPRDNDGPWTHFEVGYPSERIESLMPYCENPETPTSTVYGYVPGKIIEKIIDAHGGFEATVLMKRKS